MLRSAFDTAEKVINTSSATPITLTYDEWCESKFVEKAVATLNLGLKVPTSA